MHILFLSDNFVPETNAAASRVYERACYWVRWGHKVTVLTSAPNKPEGKVYPGYKNHWYKSESIDGIEVIRVKTFVTKNEGFFLRMIDYLSYMISSTVVGIFLKRPDVVCATSPQFFAAVSGWLVALKHRRPYVLEISDLWPGSIAAVGVVKVNFFLVMAEKLELFLYRRAAKIITLTEAFKSDIVSRNIPENKVEAILNGVDVQRVAEIPKDQILSNQLGLDGKMVIGYLGTHGLAQGLPAVIKMIADPKIQALDRIKFLFVGAGAERSQVESLVKSLNLKNVSLLPAQPKSEMNKLWSLVDVALVSLKNDAVFKQFIPSKIFEAMGAKKPILLLCPQGEAHNILNKTGAGWAIEPEDQRSFYEKLEGLNNQTLGYEKTKESSGNAAPHFSRETQAQLFINSLEPLV